MSATNRKYYVVRVTFFQVKALSGTILTKEDSVGHLRIEDGYYQCGSGFDEVTGERFKTAPSMTTIMKWDGMPWYYRIKTAEVIEVSEIEVRSLDRKTVSLGAPK